MKTKDIKKEIKGKSESDLNKLLSEKTGALRDFRFGIAGSNSKNVREGRMLRRDIARVKTQINLITLSDLNPKIRTIRN